MNVKNCSVCDTVLEKVLIFPNYPITDVYLDKPEVMVVDQSLGVCPKCGHAQLNNFVDPSILYGRYSFRTSHGGSTTVNDDLRNFIGDRKFKRIVDVGCNDCYLLNSLRDNAEQLIGIDPVLSGREKEFSDSKLTVIGDFIENVDLPIEDNTLYISSHVIEHLPYPRKMINSLINSAGKDCLFVFQFPSFDYLLQDYRFDQVYNHHLQYFSLYSISYLLNDLGCTVTDYFINPHYWGTILVSFNLLGNAVVCGRKIVASSVFDKYHSFSRRLNTLNEYMNSFNDNKFGYGAALQLPVLAYHLRNDFSEFLNIIDDDVSKDGKYLINLSVPIKCSSKVDLEGSVVLITAPNFSRQILPKLIEMKPKRIIIPCGGF